MENRSRKIVVMRPAPDRAAVQAAQAAGFEVLEAPLFDHDQPPPRLEELINLIGDAGAVLAMPQCPIGGRVLESCPQLQTAMSLVIGVDHIDRDTATRLGILVCNSPALENILGVAEATVGLMVALVKNLKLNESYLRAGHWYNVANRGVIMAGRTVGFIALGRIARETAKRLSGWGMRLVAYDPYVDATTMAGLGIEKMELEPLLRAADFVSIHALLTAETRDLIGPEQLRLMKREAYLVNTSRGGIVNEAALARALNEGLIAGAALDTFGNEPLEKDSPLRAVDPNKLIMTPHIIGHPQGVEGPSFRLAMDTARKVLSGELPQFVMNPAAVERWRARFWS